MHGVRVLLLILVAFPRSRRGSQGYVTDIASHGSPVVACTSKRGQAG